MADYKVFISHSGSDTWVAKQIEGRIKSIGVKTFLDVHDIDIGADFEKVILRELKKSKEMIVLFTPWAKKRTYVAIEIGAALMNNTTVIGILYGITFDRITKDDKFPDAIKKSNLIDINDIERYFDQLQKRTSLNGK